MAKTSVNTMDQPMKIKESMAYRVFNVFNTILMILICAAMLYPFLYLVAQSFSSTEAIVAGEVGLIPKDFSVETYAFVINDGRFSLPANYRKTGIFESPSKGISPSPRRS